MPDFSKNEGQIAAICHETGPMLVLAGPGSGKTYVITHRIKRLVSECGILPNNLLVITFTKAAAMEMQSRAILLDQQCSYVQFGTFHSIFYQILQQSLPGEKLSLASDQERLNFIRAILPKGEAGEQSRDAVAQEYLKQISRRKNQIPDSGVLASGISHSDSSAQDFPAASAQMGERIYQEYQSWLLENHKLDFDDMLKRCYELLLRNPQIKRRWQERFGYILIDEFQDMNPLQYETVRLLCDNGNVFAVGDDDQAIYGFRGSDPMLMRRFVRDYAAKVVRLSVNYRCSGNIVRAASGFIAHNRSRFLKECVSAGEAGKPVEICEVPDRAAQTTVVREKILAYQKENPCRSQAILVRTNAQAAVYEGALGKKAQGRNEIREDLSAYLSFICCGKQRKDFLNIMNKPMRYISRSILLEETVDFSLLKSRLKEKPWICERLTKLERQLAFASGLDLYGQLHYIWKVMGYEDYLTERAAGDRQRLEEAAAAFDELLMKAKHYRTYAAFKQCMEEEEKEKKNKEETESGVVEDKRKNSVRVMTYHGAKGLEFDRVYLPELHYGSVPHGRMLTAEELEEERRMFYVAMTRAKESLVLLLAAEQTPSPFLAELNI